MYTLCHQASRFDSDLYLNLIKIDGLNLNMCVLVHVACDPIEICVFV